MAKIAVELEQAVTARMEAGGPGSTNSRVLAKGKGWQVGDVLCTSGPHDRRFEERHEAVSIAIVVAGSFQYRGSSGSDRLSWDLMTPGSLLLGNAESCFECGHEHGMGDRCIAFWYDPDFFEQFAEENGFASTKHFSVSRIPPLRELSHIITQSCIGLFDSRSRLEWEEISLKLAGAAIRLANGQPRHSTDPSASDRARVTDVLRNIESRPDSVWTIAEMALLTRLSPYHFLRMFETVAGLSPHQYVLRTRLRNAALKIALEDENILDIALSSGFGDVSNFNRAFRREFSRSPRQFKRYVLEEKLAIR